MTRWCQHLSANTPYPDLQTVTSAPKSLTKLLCKHKICVWYNFWIMVLLYQTNPSKIMTQSILGLYGGIFWRGSRSIQVKWSKWSNISAQSSWSSWSSQWLLWNFLQGLEAALSIRKLRFHGFLGLYKQYNMGIHRHYFSNMSKLK